MDKKYIKFRTNPRPTFEKRRFCRNCGKAISDQEHSSLEFCHKWYDSLNKAHDCKTNYHRNNDKLERDFFSELKATHKGISKRIGLLIESKGTDVTSDDLAAYDIKLNHPISYQVGENETMNTKFLYYSILSNIYTHHHKITKNEQP